LRRVLLLGALAVVLSGCAAGASAALPNTDIGAFRTDPTVSVALAAITGGDVTVRLSATNFKVIPPEQATNPHVYGEGHFHLFVDVPPTAPGEVIPKTKGIYHTAATVFMIPGLGSGRHHVWVVLGFSDHTPYEAVAVANGKVHGTIAELEFTVGPGQTPVQPPETLATPSPAASPSAQAAASPSPSAASGGGATKTVQVIADATNGGAYNPSSATASVGDTVKWDWVDDSAQHTVTSDDNKFDSGLQSKGQTFTFKFTAAGTYKYHCTVHPNMLGTLTVK
jgi:plastocyanin